MIEKTFTPLVGRNLKDHPIGRCSALLPNRMQCLKGADFEVVETLSDNKTERIYQLCRAHATVEEREMQEANEKESSKPKANSVAAPVKSDPVPAKSNTNSETVAQKPVDNAKSVVSSTGPVSVPNPPSTNPVPPTLQTDKK